MSGDLAALVKEAYKPRNPRRLKTHCLKGHELTEDNLIYRRRPDGRQRRDCRTCANARAAKYRAAEQPKNSAEHACNVAGLNRFLAGRMERLARQNRADRRAHATSPRKD